MWSPPDASIHVYTVDPSWRWWSIPHFQRHGIHFTIMFIQLLLAWSLNTRWTAFIYYIWRTWSQSIMVTLISFSRSPDALNHFVHLVLFLVRYLKTGLTDFIFIWWIDVFVDTTDAIYLSWSWHFFWKCHHFGYLEVNLWWQRCNC